MQQLDKFMCQMFNFFGVECGRTNIKPGCREGFLKGQAHNLFTQITCILTGKPSFAEQIENAMMSSKSSMNH